MSAASVLRSFSPSAMPGPVMPMDVAMRFYISHSPPPLRGFLSSYEDLQRAKNRANQTPARSRSSQQLYKPLRPCLSSQQKASAASAGEDGGRVGGWSSAKAGKKKVVFADTKGMSLTAIHVFSKFDDEPYQSKQAGGLMEELQFDMMDLDLKAGATRSLALDFKQPSADYLDFRNRLIRNSVCLENCSLQEHSLTGTIKVRNIGFEKSVQVHATFDSWASSTDVDCTFMNNVYGCQDSDTFAFALDLPASILPQDRVEFCIRFKVQDQTFWDNNDGKNYVIKHVGWNGAAPVEQKKPSEHKSRGVKLLEMELDQLSPRMSSGLFPGWQSWGQIDNAVPYW